LGINSPKALRPLVIFLFKKLRAASSVDEEDSSDESESEPEPESDFVVLPFFERLEDLLADEEDEDELVPVRKTSANMRRDTMTETTTIKTVVAIEASPDPIFSSSLFSSLLLLTSVRGEKLLSHLHPLWNNMHY